MRSILHRSEKNKNLTKQSDGGTSKNQKTTPNTSRPLSLKGASMFNERTGER